MQLKHGSDFTQLQNPKTMVALRELGNLALLEKEEAESLQYNYKMLRLIENGLRLIYDESTDLLDFEKIQEYTIIQLLNHHGYEATNLRQTVETATNNVREIYLKYF